MTVFSFRFPQLVEREPLPVVASDGGVHCRFLSDPTFLARFRAGEEAALGTLYWEYRRRVERALSSSRLHRLRNAELADVIQEVFARAFAPSARSSYDGRRAYGAYLIAVARNVLTDWIRKSNRELLTYDSTLEAGLLAQDSDDNHPPWAEARLLKCVQDYLADLGGPLRELYACRFVKNMSQIQAANELGLTRQELRTREKGLRSGLLAALKRVGLEGD